MNYKKLLIAFCAAGLFLSGVSNAQDQEWESNGLRISVGTNYRNFSSIEISTPALIGGHKPFGTGKGNTTSANEMKENTQANRNEISNASNNFDDLNGNSPVPNFNIISYRHETKSGHSIDADDRFFPVIGFGYDLFQWKECQISLVSNLQYVDMEVSGKADSDAYWAVLVKGQDVTPHSTRKYSNSREILKVRADIRGFVWDMGLQISKPVNNVDLTLAAGPSINFIKINSDFCSYNSDVDKVIGGLYIEAGATYWFKPQYGIAFDLRYDTVFDDVNTNYVSMDLDSLGAGIKFIYNF